MLLEGLKPVSQDKPCRIGKLLTSLEAADQVILKAALEDIDQWPANTLSKALAERGLTVADGTISKHRRNLCACQRGN